MQCLLDGRHDDVDVEGHQQPQPHAGQRADHAGHRALHHEDAHDGARARAQRAQDGDVALLVGHRHHQGRDEVEGCHRDDQRQHDAHHAFLDLHRIEPGRVGAGPVAHQDVGAHAAGQLAGHAPRVVHIAELELHAGGPAGAEQLGRVIKVDQRQARVVLVMARAEGAHHREGAQPGHDARRRHLPAGRHQRDLVALGHVQLAGQLRAQHDVPGPGLQPGEGAVLELGAEAGDLRLVRRRDAADDGAAHVVAAVGDQALGGDEGRRADHLRPGARLGRGGLPVGQGLAGVVQQLHVGDDVEHAVPDLLLEAVHHRQHDDQRHHAQRDAHHRHAGDEADEAVAPPTPAGAHIAPADLEFIRQGHGEAGRGAAWGRDGNWRGTAGQAGTLGEPSPAQG
mmetsp:Transcript_9916/g.23225  ORF Transcript_9916/g.23225 Transcript_9916/m.23225 type:complete len:396 (-) Transcript_9916:1377-2564(-)